MTAPRIVNGRHVGGCRPPHPGHYAALPRVASLFPALPEPPAAFDYGAAAGESFGRVYCNDRLGCCTVACAAHLVGAWTGATGDAPAVTLTDDQVQALYGRWCGYDPSAPLAADGTNPTDAGGDPMSVIQSWAVDGIPLGGHTVTRMVAIDPTVDREVRAMLWLCEGLYAYAALPESWLSVSPDGVWDAAAPVAANGHAFAVLGWDGTHYVVCSWGVRVRMTPAAMQRVVGNSANGGLIAVLSPDVVSRVSAKAPTGLDWTDVQRVFEVAVQAAPEAWVP